LIRAALAELKARGYGSILLVPAEESLFGYYERLGFRQVGTIREQVITAGAPVPIRALTAGEYAEARRSLLPENAVMQEGPCLELLSGYARFYATQHALAAVTDGMVWELLGDKKDAPGILGALGIPEATLRTPGADTPFAMGLGLGGPVHFGLALD